MKKALITGANKGIGFETAKQLLQKGFYVYIGSRDLKNGISAVEKLKAEGLIHTEAVQLDVTDERSVKMAREEIGKKTTVLDVLINNAGINGGQPPYTALEATSDQFLAAFDTNVIGVARVTKAFIDLLRSSKEPRIVNVSTSVGSLALQSDPGWPAYDYAKYAVYGASKAALNMYTVHLAYELRDTPFKVNAVCPGYTSTDFTFHNGGSVETAANRIIKYALIDQDGPTGKFFSEETNPGSGEIPW
ncbi:NAD(P)-dependent dehydrogenase, short-chain alcohol dehydrogenase family [Chitinophaga terrae (ex Kim and Jung 2007)]|uniref:NAD(P)-dependent dehydrogenase, short-chain alcohol dehydrogenase family n=1 Tax=Chitinophaga terrae (ex Kim and Jung 2007) TaxID=408074 RepID=A0A1H4GCW9_9BACT|nr:SDR family oxidoreductase [Chitinophaga terrae (ex Kim and Jung 2007)]GEP93343.1 short-chain dehydrogenase [Chitinophaga terrae (ex Kim and Jung 2007)]SEB07455.1 NAD(P)-dependent dehydrogenase, short-chain alcohol dehydrogenase family [Chitinophaga terrae (ex Kim and Jung 2007)]